MMPIPTPRLSGQTTVSTVAGPTTYTTVMSNDGSSATTNATLTIELRVLMLPYPMQPGNSVKIFSPVDSTVSWSVPIRAWDASSDELGTFKQWVKAQAEAFWDNTGLCLVPPGDDDAFLWPGLRKPTHRLNVDCRFRFLWATGPGDADITVYCACISGQQNVFTLPSSMSGASRTGFLDSGDLMPWVFGQAQSATGPMVPANVSWCIPHEFGHAIGLPHIGVLSRFRPCLATLASATMGGGAADVCYAGGSQAEATNIMGYGSGISALNSLPWLLRAPLHTGSHLVDWRVSVGKRPPKSI